MENSLSDIILKSWTEALIAERTDLVKAEVEALKSSALTKAQTITPQIKYIDVQLTKLYILSLAEVKEIPMDIIDQIRREIATPNP